MKNISSLQIAVSIAGGQASLAKILGLKQGHIWWWLNRSKRVPANQVIAIEAATGVSRHDLRPDVFGPAPAPSHTSDRPPAAADPDQERVGAERFFRDPEEKKPARIVILKTSEPPE